MPTVSDGGSHSDEATWRRSEEALHSCHATDPPRVFRGHPARFYPHFGEARFIAWRMRRSFWGDGRLSLRHCWSRQMGLDYGLVPEPCAVLARLVRCATNSWHILSLSVTVTESRLPDVGAGEAQHLFHVANPPRALQGRPSRLQPFSKGLSLSPGVRGAPFWRNAVGARGIFWTTGRVLATTPHPDSP